VYGWLHRNVDPLVYDWHDDPYAVLSEVGQPLDPAAVQDLGAVVPTIARAIAETLRLPYVSITVDLADGPVTSEFGKRDPRSELRAMPLSFGGVQIGVLDAAPRRPDEPLSDQDTRLLRDLARQVEIAVHAAQLGESLQTARERLVIAREEERRRIRRDLHDGLAPTLAAIGMQLGSLRRSHMGKPLPASERSGRRSTYRTYRTLASTGSALTRADAWPWRR
jgi:signal transduction histidine kinase